jgi:hypothetical protein
MTIKIEAITRLLAKSNPELEKRAFDAGYKAAQEKRPRSPTKDALMQNILKEAESNGCADKVARKFDDGFQKHCDEEADKVLWG